jgi:hypothetical protein
MKIVGFEDKGELRLGVVDGDQVIDLKVADEKAPHDLREWLARHDGDVKPLGDLAKRAPASGRDVCAVSRDARICRLRRAHPSRPYARQHLVGPPRERRGPQGLKEGFRA